MKSSIIIIGISLLTIGQISCRRDLFTATKKVTFKLSGSTSEAIRIEYSWYNSENIIQLGSAYPTKINSDWKAEVDAYKGTKVTFLVADWGGGINQINLKGEIFVENVIKNSANAIGDESSFYIESDAQ